MAETKRINTKEQAEIEISSWKEEVYIETAEHVICGTIFMPKIGKQSRLLSEVLNSRKSFIAVKDCTLEYKNNPMKELCKHKFLQVNLSSIIIMRPLDED